jgi:hypothetical protein
MSHKSKNLETYHPLKHVKFQWHGPTRISMLGQFEPMKHIPPKHVTFWELCFGPIEPFSMFPQAILIHDTLDLFQFSHISFNFHQTTLLGQLMKVME